MRNHILAVMKGDQMVPVELSGRRILVVEDELLVAMSLETILESEGCVVVGPVSRVAKGLALLERETLDAAILDLNLHGEQPVTLANALVARDIPFVIMSGYSKESGNGPAFQTAPFLEKPIDQKRLLHTLRTICRSSAERRHPSS